MHDYGYVHYVCGYVYVFLNASTELFGGWQVDSIYAPGLFISQMADLESQYTAEVYQ